jgi:hypothetical protein
MVVDAAMLVTAFLATPALPIVAGRAQMLRENVRRDTATATAAGMDKGSISGLSYRR